MRAAVARTQMPTGGTRETKVAEYWLTEEEVLFLLARSRTKVAPGALRA